MALAAEGNNGASTRRGFVLPAWIPAAAIALVLLTVAYRATLPRLARMWQHNENYSHGFLIAPVSVVLVWLMRRGLAEVPARPTWRGLPLVLAGAVLQIVGSRGDVTMFQAYSFVLLIGGLVWTWFGFERFRRALFPIAFLIFAAPTFPVFLNQVSYRLKTVVAAGSVHAAQALGVAVSRQGMDLIFPSGAMTIDRACSGLNSLIALMAMGALFAHLGTGSSWRRWLLFLCSIPVAVAANTVRITSLCIYAAVTDTTRATGLFHDIGGFVLFGAALIAMLILKRVLRC